LVHLVVYLKLMLTRLFKNLNNVKSFESLD
jgi:hypothetical protein